jgi:DNA modification methylase
MILQGDAREQLKTLPADWFHCCVTSPPYFNLRSYLAKDDPQKALEIGSESASEVFIATLVSVFAEVRRVLRDDGVLFLNLGDSYQKDGSLCNMPHRVAEALKADGWHWRSTIIWAKKSPMPESVAGWRWTRKRRKVAAQTRGANHSRTQAGGNPSVAWPGNGIISTAAEWEDLDGYELRRGRWRPTTGHEYVFMFAKSERYFCDGDAVKETATAWRGPSNKEHHKYAENGQRSKAWHNFVAVETRNPRSVWSLSSESYKGAHFAAFPTELAHRCINAGTSSAGCCNQCGSAFAPVVETKRVATRPGTGWKGAQPGSPLNEHTSGHLNVDPLRHVALSSVDNYLPTCDCENVTSEPCRVLDPFGGSGTVGQVSKVLGREFTLIELNAAYIPLIEQRINTLPKWAKKHAVKEGRYLPNQQTLFNLAA